MCVVSMIHDDWNRRTFPDTPVQDIFKSIDFATRAELEELRKEVESLKKLLKAAKIYDEETGQPDCDVDEKTQLLRKICEKLEIDYA